MSQIKCLDPRTDDCLVPSKLATFYRSVGGDYDALFLDTPHTSLSYIYQCLGCVHSLQPTTDDFAPPSIPALISRGYVRWQMIQLLLDPEEHVPYLQEAIRKFDVVDPRSGKFFPKILPKALFPERPDEEMVRWHDTAINRLREEAENESSQSERATAENGTEPEPPPQDRRRTDYFPTYVPNQKGDQYSSWPIGAGDTDRNGHSINRSQNARVRGRTSSPQGVQARRKSLAERSSASTRPLSREYTSRPSPPPSYRSGLSRAVEVGDESMTKAVMTSGSESDFEDDVELDGYYDDPSSPTPDSAGSSNFSPPPPSPPPPPPITSYRIRQPTLTATATTKTQDDDGDRNCYRPRGYSDGQFSSPTKDSFSEDPIRHGRRRDSDHCHDRDEPDLPPRSRVYDVRTPRLTSSKSSSQAMNIPDSSLSAYFYPPGVPSGLPRRPPPPPRTNYRGANVRWRNESSVHTFPISSASTPGSSAASTPSSEIPLSSSPPSPATMLSGRRSRSRHAYVGGTTTMISSDRRGGDLSSTQPQIHRLVSSVVGVDGRRYVTDGIVWR